MRLLACFLSLCLLSACYGLQPQAAQRYDNPTSRRTTPPVTRLALLSTDGQHLSPAGPPWQQAGLQRLHNLLQEQGLPLAPLAPASGEADVLSQHFPSLRPPDHLARLNQSAADQQANLLVLLKQSPKPDLRVGLLQREIRYTCEAAVQVYDPSQNQYLFQVRGLGENGYQSFAQTGTLVGMLTATLLTPALRLGFTGEQQQQGTQVISIVQIAAGLTILGIIAWDFVQGPVPAEERQQQACDQALQAAAQGLTRELQAVQQP